MWEQFHSVMSCLRYTIAQPSDKVLLEEEPPLIAPSLQPNQQLHSTYFMHLIGLVGFNPRVRKEAREKKKHNIFN